MCICVYVYIYLIFHTLFHYGLSKDIEYNSLCYTYDLVVYSMYNSLHLLTWNPTPSLRSLLFLPLGNHKFVLSSLWVCLESSLLLHLSTENRPLLYGVQASYVQRLVIFSLIPMTMACGTCFGVFFVPLCTHGSVHLCWAWWHSWSLIWEQGCHFSLEVVPVKRLIKPLLEVFESLVLNVSHGGDLCFRLANCFMDSVLHVLNINIWIDKHIALSSKNLFLRSYFMEVDELACNPPASICPSQALVSGKGLWVASFWLGVRSPHELSSRIPIGLGVLTELNKFAVFWA